jgi:hypothetical protein
LIRGQASSSNSIWMTTHSESIVRQSKLNELWLVDKKRGKREIKSAVSDRLQQKNLALTIEKDIKKAPRLNAKGLFFIKSNLIK